MSNIVFKVPLLCAICGTLSDERSNVLYTAYIGHESTHTYAERGDVLELVIMDFEDGYFTLRLPSSERAAVIAIEVWGCSACFRTQCARVRFEWVDPTHWRFSDAEVVPLSKTIVDSANFISRRLEEWAPNPEDDSEYMREIRGRLGVNS